MDYMLYKDHKIRLLEKDGKVWFRLVDISRALSLTGKAYKRKLIAKSGFQEGDSMLTSISNGHSTTRIRLVTLHGMALFAATTTRRDEIIPFLYFCFELMETRFGLPSTYRAIFAQHQSLEERVTALENPPLNKIQKMLARLRRG